MKSNFFTRLNEVYDKVDLLATQPGSEKWVEGLVTLAEAELEHRNLLDFVVAILERRSQNDLRLIDLSIWSHWLETAPVELILPLQRLALRRQHGPLFEQDKPSFEYHLKRARNYVADVLQEFNDARRLARRQEERAVRHTLTPRPK